MIEKEPIANRVREIRLRLGLQQQKLAQEVGVSRQTIIAIEKGRLENPTIRVCLKIARILREPVDYVFYLDRRENPTKSALATPESDIPASAPASPVFGNTASPDPESGSAPWPPNIPDQRSTRPDAIPIVSPRLEENHTEAISRYIPSHQTAPPLPDIPPSPVEAGVTFMIPSAEPKTGDHTDEPR